MNAFGKQALFFSLGHRELSEALRTSGTAHSSQITISESHEALPVFVTMNHIPSLLSSCHLELK